MSERNGITKAFCPSCGANVRVDVLFEKIMSWSDDNFDGTDRFWMLQCRGCDKIFFGHGVTFSENTEAMLDEATGAWYFAPVERQTFYPRTSNRRKPAWFSWQFEVTHSRIATILHEVYTALDHDISNLATSGIRTVLDTTAQTLGVDNQLSFSEKIEDMRKKPAYNGARTRLFNNFS